MKKKNIVILALPRHDEKFNSTSWQLAVEFARSGNQVFYVDHAYTWMEFLRAFYKKPFLKALMNTFFPQWKFVEGVKVFPPVLFIPVNFLPNGRLYKWLNSANQKRLAAILNKSLVKYAGTAYELINSFDFYLNEIEQHLIGPKKYIYHCIDPMVKGYTKKHGVRQELEIAHKADFVIATAPMLHERFQRNSIKSFLVPNAADLANCSRALLDETRGLEQIAMIDGPVFGYLGNIERRMDFKLLMETVDRLCDWNLVLVGPYEKKYIPEELFVHPRVHLIGAVNRNDVPSVLKELDVAIIPFKQDEVSRGIYPLKLYEYLGAGLPVVSTNFNPDILGQFKPEMVTVAETAHGFAMAVEGLHRTNCEFVRHKRVRLAGRNTWEKRAEQFLSILEKN